jgi:SAM-dependent methyltransferase
MSRNWTADDVLQLARGYQAACVLAAAADLDLFTCLGEKPLGVREVAGALSCESRAVTIVLDALVALELLEKGDGRYSVPPGLLPLLAQRGPGSILAMARHQANCLRRWAQLTQVARTGRPPERQAGPDGWEADTRSFIGAMHDISAPVAREVIRGLEPLAFHLLLDVGGASGTWTAAFLAACPGSSAILFDLPEVIPLAKSRVAEVGMGDRVRLAAGDFLKDPLPAGADLAWVSAIIHQNSREQNRALFASVLRSLVPGGRIAIRDTLMDPSRTSPVAGALFAVNMLVGTEGGGTYTFDEVREDLEAAGFREVALLRRDPAMNSLVAGKKPGG